MIVIKSIPINEKNISPEYKSQLTVRLKNDIKKDKIREFIFLLFLDIMQININKYKVEKLL
jgi:hypothetical protein